MIQRCTRTDQSSLRFLSPSYRSIQVSTLRLPYLTDSQVNTSVEFQDIPAGQVNKYTAATAITAEDRPVGTQVAMWVSMRPTNAEALKVKGPKNRSIAKYIADPTGLLT